MRNTVLIATGLLVSLALSGCFGFNGGSDFEPGTDFEPTGNTVHLEATVLDILDKEVYPGLNANFWGFCFKPKDPNDQYSADAIEYYPNRTADVAEPSWQGTCSVPGPTLRVQQGDRVIVDFNNQHVHHHTIHWHGQYVPWESDGVPGSTQDSVASGELFTYDFIAKRAGTLWYHCHVDTQLHIMQGLYGVIIVEPQDQSMEPEDIDREQVLVLSTIRRDLMENTPRRQANPHADHMHLGSCGETGQPGCQNPPLDITADVFMINGQSFPNTLTYQDGLIKLEPGERLRLRVLNAGTTFETLHPHGHDFLITHVDGNPVPPDARVWKDTVPIGPGERVDLLLEGRAGNEGIWVMHTHVVNHVTNDHMYPGGMLTKIIYPEYLDDKHPFESELAGGVGYTPPVDFASDFSRTRTLTSDPTANGDGSFTLDWPYPMAQPCGVKDLYLTVDVDASGFGTGAIQDLSGRILGPGGSTFEDLTFDDSGHAEYEYNLVQGTPSPFSKGNYTVEVSGTTIVPVDVTYGVTIDYIEDTTEHALFGAPCS